MSCINCMYVWVERKLVFVLVINKSIEYCDWSGRIFKLLNSSLQGAFLFEFVIILINLFWILNISLLYSLIYKITKDIIMMLWSFKKHGIWRFITFILDTLQICIHPLLIWRIFRRGGYYSGITIFSHLPANIVFKE